MPDGRAIPTPHAAMPALPPLTQKLMLITEELTRVLEEELPLVESRDTARLSELLRRKQDLAMNYQATIKALSENLGIMNTLTVDQRKILRRAGEKLDEVAGRNVIALKAAHSATDRLLRVVMEEVRRDTMKNSPYSGRGLLAAEQSRSTGPVAINQRI